MTASSPSPERCYEVFNLVERHVEDVYGLPVRIRDVPAPFTGDLDGAEIHVDYEESPENALFILCHLFGHTVQWNLSARAREIGTVIQSNPSPELMAELGEYEEEACRYSLALLHRLGITDLDQWLSDFARCDLAYLTHFYRTGEKRPFLSFWKSGEPVLEPLEIPPFEPQRWISRWEGVVV